MVIGQNVLDNVYDNWLIVPDEDFNLGGRRL
jgi:hypothetical protein